MTRQYQLATELLRLLESSRIVPSLRYRLESRIFRLKILLLQRDGCTAADLALLCPVSTLERLQAMLAEYADQGETAAIDPAIQITLDEVIDRLERESLD